MALEIHEHPKGEERHTTTGLFVSKERLWLTVEGDVVSDGDPKAAFLYLIPGAEIPLAEAEAKGLVKPKADKKRTPKGDK